MGRRRGSHALQAMRHDEMHLEELETPTAMLTRLADDGASGEIVAAGPSLEVHIYLFRGRVAWATSSRAPNALLRYLLEHCGLDRQAVGEVVAECRRTRKRFGETLIEWGVASRDQVRQALRAQISESIESMVELSSVRAMFLPRDLEYSEDLTFALAEVYEPAEIARDDNRFDELERELRVALPNALWVYGIDDAVEISESGPVGARLGYLRVVSAALGAAGANQITVRCRLGAMIGRAVGTGQWLYTAVREAGHVGLANAVINHLVGNPSRQLGTTPRAELDDSPDPELLESVEPMKEALGQSPELLATMVFRLAGSGCARVHRQGVDVEEIEQRARGLAEVLRHPLTAHLGLSDEMSGFAYEHVSAHVGEGQAHHFGTLLREEDPACLWMTLEQGAPIGLGWALLTALDRQLAGLVIQ